MRNAMILGIFAVMLTLLSGPASAEHVIDSTENPAYLYVLSGTSGTLDGDTLTLNGATNVVYFSDRPARKAGHMPLEQFVRNWNKVGVSFKEDPPNATLSVLTEESHESAVVELMGAEKSNGSIKMKVVVLEGKVPQNFKSASLFIDAIGPGGVPPLCF